MKKPDRIERNSKRAPVSRKLPERAEPGKRVRVRLQVPKALHAAVKRGAKQLGLTISAFVELAIREGLSLIECNLKGGA
jgi:hypothetical protein